MKYKTIQLSYGNCYDECIELMGSLGWSLIHVQQADFQSGKNNMYLTFIGDPDADDPSIIPYIKRPSGMFFSERKYKED